MELTISVVIIAVGLVFFFVLLARHARRTQALRLNTIKQTLLLISEEEPQPLTQNNGWRVQLHGYVVDVTMEMGNHYKIHVHKTLSSDAPSIALHCVQAANLYNGIQPTTDANLTLVQEHYQGPIKDIAKGLFAPLDEDIEKLQMYSTEPLASLTIKDRWVTASRDVLPGSFSVRGITEPSDVETHLIKIINQTAKLLDRISLEPCDEADLIRDLYYGSTPFEALRHKTLRQLMQKHGQTPQAESVWQWILNNGNLYDTLFLLNHNQQRFLREISPARLLALVNGIQKSQRFETSALPQLLAKRFDFDVVLNPNLDQDVSHALIVLGMSDPQNVETKLVLGKLWQQSTPERQKQLLRMARENQYSPMIDLLVNLGMTPPVQQLLEIVSCIEQIAKQTQEHFDRDRAERYLLEVIDQDIPDLTCAAVEALGYVGMVEAITRLRVLREHNTWKIGKLARETKRAMELIEKRLKALPNRGGITLSQTEQNAGALTVSTQDGTLEMIEHE